MVLFQEIDVGVLCCENSLGNREFKIKMSYQYEILFKDKRELG